ncbi:MAG TPA: hypothetical protein QGH28_01920 [Chloroflexota bacterium]|nr:hypothetical protein [Chloroflexota bacterium]
MIQLGRAYLAQHELDDADWRIDVVVVRIDRAGGATVEIIRDVVSE